ncbi:unnamed protein product, partial [Urochloa humidicola]
PAPGHLRLLARSLSALPPAPPTAHHQHWPSPPCAATPTSPPIPLLTFPARSQCDGEESPLRRRAGDVPLDLAVAGLDPAAPAHDEAARCGGDGP